MEQNISSFTENFRNFVNAAPIDEGASLGQTVYDADIPNINPSYNSKDWQERVAVPFSYADGKRGKRLYGIMYMPETAAWKLSSNGNTSEKELEAYGAELMDGRSLTSRGLQNLFEKNRGSFVIETEAMKGAEPAATYRQRSSGGVSPAEYNPIPGVSVKNTPSLRTMQYNLRSLQGKNLETMANRGQRYPEQSSFLSHLRETRGL